MAWEWGTNEYFCLPCVTILWCLSWKLPKDKVKMKSAYLSLKRVILTLRFWFPFPKNWTIINDYRFIYVTLWESRHLEEFNMSVSLLNSLLLKEEFIQRSSFTNEPPIVAAASFPKFLKILDPSLIFVLLRFIEIVWLCCEFDLLRMIVEWISLSADVAMFNLVFPLLQILVFLSFN